MTHSCQIVWKFVKKMIGNLWESVDICAPVQERKSSVVFRINAKLQNSVRIEKETSIQQNWACWVHHGFSFGQLMKHQCQSASERIKWVIISVLNVLNIELHVFDMQYQVTSHRRETFKYLFLLESELRFFGSRELFMELQVRPFCT